MKANAAKKFVEFRVMDAIYCHYITIDDVTVTKLAQLVRVSGGVAQLVRAPS